jgi:hypothetical protein
LIRSKAMTDSIEFYDWFNLIRWLILSNLWLIRSNLVIDLTDFDDSIDWIHDQFLGIHRIPYIVYHMQDRLIKNQKWILSNVYSKFEVKGSFLMDAYWCHLVASSKTRTCLDIFWQIFFKNTKILYFFKTCNQI